MPRAPSKSAILTFKAEPALVAALRAVPNRSRFIRDALLEALNHACPLCGGSGVFTPAQKRHWDEFRKAHALRECRDCRALHLVCSAGRGHADKARRRAPR